MARNIFTQIWQMPELRRRVLFTLALLGVYRLGIFIPAPGIDRLVLGEFFAQQDNSLLGLYDMFSGGALTQFSVFVLGIMPYITASILCSSLSLWFQHSSGSRKRANKAKIVSLSIRGI